MADICGDNRFELIEKYKQKLLDATNIGDSPEEMAVIDNILFRFWQVGWLEKLELFGNSEQLELDTISRAAVLDEIHKYMEERDYTIGTLYDNICEMPSAQPDIVACGDCIHWICHDRRCGYWNHGVKPLDWCCHAERRSDG